MYDFDNCGGVGVGVGTGTGPGDKKLGCIDKGRRFKRPSIAVVSNRAAQNVKPIILPLRDDSRSLRLLSSALSKARAFFFDGIKLFSAPSEDSGVAVSFKQRLRFFFANQLDIETQRLRCLIHSAFNQMKRARNSKSLFLSVLAGSPIRWKNLI
jgi:hypothetical protein